MRQMDPSKLKTLVDAFKRGLEDGYKNPHKTSSTFYEDPDRQEAWERGCILGQTVGMEDVSAVIDDYE